MRYVSAVVFTLVVGSALAFAQMQPGAAHADLKDAQGNTIGHATLTPAPKGVLVHVELTNAPGGEHAFHVHAVGTCEPPFTSAGGHFNPMHHQHGFLNSQGRHAGDLPNVWVPSDGHLTFDAFAEDATLGSGPTSLFDADGSALVMHAGADDYKSDPAGDAGPRIACGVVTKG